VAVFDALKSIALECPCFFAVRIHLKANSSWGKAIVLLEKIIIGNAILWYSFS